MFGGRKRRRAAWSAVAASLGGSHHLPTRWWRGDEWIDAAPFGVPVRLDSYTVSTGKSSQTYTRIVGACAYGPAPKLKLSKHGFFSTIGKAIGMQDIPVGDPVFDETFVVKADSVPLARRLFTPATCAHLMGFTDCWLAIKKDEIELTGNGYWEEPVRMRGAIEIVGALAARDLYNTAALAALAPLVQAAGERPRVVLDTGARVVVSAEDRGDDLVMVARVDDPVELAAMTIEVTNGRADEATRLPQGAQLHLAGVGTGTLSLGSALTFAWKTIEVPPAQLGAGASLLGAIAAQGGVYR